MTKLIKIQHPKLGNTNKLIAIRMINGALHRNDKGHIIRFRTQNEAIEYALEAFSPTKQPQITILI